MDEEKLELDQDLGTKLDRLKWTHEQPELFITEHFASIRNEIDFDAERLIQAYRDGDSDSANKISKLNQARRMFIDFLGKMEQKLFSQLCETSNLSAYKEVLESLEKRVDEFYSVKASFNVSNAEDTYLQLALEMIDAQNELEGRLLDKQTFVYLPLIERTELGNLVYLSDSHLNQYEISYIKTHDGQNDFSFSHKHIYQAFHVKFNRLLAVPVSRPFVLKTENLIIDAILSYIHFQYHSGNILYIGENVLVLDPVKRINGPRNIFYSRDNFMEAVRLPELNSSVSTLNTLDFSQNRLRSFELNETVMASLDTLDLNNNQLAKLDERLFAKGTNLKRLGLDGALLPGVGFSLSFLPSLTNLSQLELTLPDAAVDFDVFKGLVNLFWLKLFSAASLDTQCSRPKLTDEHFIQLSAMPMLSNLKLSHFELKTLRVQSLSGFKDLYSLTLSHNNIDWIDAEFGSEKAYFNRLSSCHYLDLSYNRIEKLPQGLFAKASRLKNLDLKHNLLRRIDRGIFKNLSQLKTINLDHNSIESIETDALKPLRLSRHLPLNNCQLKMIDNRMFKEMKKLCALDLNNNQIEGFRVITDADNVLIKGFLSTAEYELVSRELFANMTRLRRLEMRGNKLEKLDLNCFRNLVELAILNVSCNRISELNEEIRHVTLTNLESLDLSENQLTCISRRAFSESKRLKKLKLSENKLERMDEDFFEPFEELEQVELQGNNLALTITARFFNRCVHLKEVNLLGNPQVRIEDDAFCELKSLTNVRLEFRTDFESSKTFLQKEENKLFFSGLTILSMVNCSLENLDAFKRDDRFSKLEELDLSRNEIRNLNPDSLSSLFRLTNLNLSQNLLENLDNPLLFQDFKRLEKLNISANKLKHIHRRLFSCLNKLESLDMSNNPTISIIDCGIFRGLFSLKHLNLAGNNIASIDIPLLFRSCRLLECLDLSNNQLDYESINETSMSGSTAQNLKELMLANNCLERMDFLRELYRLEKLDLSGNKIESVTSNGVNIIGRLVKLKHVNLSGNKIKSLDIGPDFSQLASPKYQLEYIAV